MKPFLKKAGVALGLASTTLVASAQTDLPTTITAVSGYWTSVETLAIGVLLFIIGRRIVKKI